MATHQIRKGLNRRWDYMRRLSLSVDEFERTSALALAVAGLEVGLDAIGISPDDKRGVQAKLQDAISRFPLRRLPPTAEIRSAFNARNKAVHHHIVASAKSCPKHISTFHNVWNSMRGYYVTRKRAGHLAATILESAEISEVYLFGSLARLNRRHPRDIDLLIFDHGEFSALGVHYGSTDPVILAEYFDKLFSPSAIRCGWLDLVIVDGDRFGEDPHYTLSLAGQHADSLFFLNIADRLLKYDRSNRRWMETSPKVFQRFARLRKQLENLFIVPPAHKKSSAQTTRKLKKSTKSPK